MVGRRSDRRGRMIEAGSCRPGIICCPVELPLRFTLKLTFLHTSNATREAHHDSDAGTSSMQLLCSQGEQSCPWGRQPADGELSRCSTTSHDSSTILQALSALKGSGFIYWQCSFTDPAVERTLVSRERAGRIWGPALRRSDLPSRNFRSSQWLIEFDWRPSERQSAYRRERHSSGSHRGVTP